MNNAGLEALAGKVMSHAGLTALAGRKVMSHAGLTALAGRGGTSPAKASSPASIFHYPLSIIFCPLVITNNIHYN